ncbi:MAG: NAD-dependent epimerase/dehydratase family protein [Lachnospiraceae bacterium]
MKNSIGDSRAMEHGLEIKRAVITGATGMIGTMLIEYLLKQDIEVLALVRPNSNRMNHLSRSIKLHIKECDLSQLSQITGEEGTYDAFFHLGWCATFGDGRNDMRLQHENIGYTLDAVALASRLGCRVFVGAGSQAEYGRIDGPLKPDTPTHPENGYGVAKLCAGQMSRIACKQLGMKHVWVRILSVYGPFDGAKTMVMSGISALLAGEAPAYTKGEQMWDYLYAADAARALFLCATYGKEGEVYCLGSGKVRPLKDYIGMIRDAIDPNAKILLGKIPYPDNPVMYLCADITNLTRDTGFLPEVGFEEGIKKTVEWCKKEMSL